MMEDYIILYRLKDNIILHAILPGLLSACMACAFLFSDMAIIIKLPVSLLLLAFGVGTVLLYWRTRYIVSRKGETFLFCGYNGKLPVPAEELLSVKEHRGYWGRMFDFSVMEIQTTTGTHKLYVPLFDKRSWTNFLASLS